MAIADQIIRCSAALVQAHAMAAYGRHLSHQRALEIAMEVHDYCDAIRGTERLQVPNYEASSILPLLVLLRAQDPG